MSSPRRGFIRALTVWPSIPSTINVNIDQTNHYRNKIQQYCSIVTTDPVNEYLDHAFWWVSLTPMTVQRDNWRSSVLKVSKSGCKETDYVRLPEKICEHSHARIPLSYCNISESPRQPTSVLFEYLCNGTHRNEINALPKHKLRNVSKKIVLNVLKFTF